MPGLTQDEINELLHSELKRATGRTTVTKQQTGPLRLHDKERRCAKRGCGSSTFYTVQGIPYCGTHALEELNEMLVAQGFKGYVHVHITSPTPLPSGRVVNASTKAKLDVGWSLNNFECIHGIKLNVDCEDCING